MEIERKWLLRELPKGSPDAVYLVQQFYTSLNPEIRFRKCTPCGDYENKKPYTLTFKGEGNLSREEVEQVISEEFYNAVCKCALPLQKLYSQYHDIRNTLKVEVSLVYTGEPFIYAEVEFSTEEEALAYEFPWPELVIKEVTDDPSFKMKNLWKRVNNL